MQSIIKLALGLMLAAGLTTTAMAKETPKETYVEKYGQLSVKGGHIVNQKGEPVALAGVSYFWSNSGWGQEKFYNRETVDYFANEWDVSLIRAAVGAMGPGSILEDPANEKRAETLIDAAVANGVYILIDWHSHRAEKNPDEAVAFFSRMSKKYGHLPNVIYEIYNEPLNDVTWSETVKPYALKVIAAIRANDPDNIIVVGSPTWSQDLDKVTEDPITGYDNISYTMHFYAGTHNTELRRKTKVAIDAGHSVFVTEWGTVNADGDGGVATESVQTWFDFMSEHCLSHANWSVAEKKEGASIFKSGTSPTGPFTDADLTPSGLEVKRRVKGATRVCH